MFSAKELKKDFPILARKINDFNLVYLDSAASAQKPQQVIDALVDYYQNHNSNVHTGIHTLSEEATQMYENARKKVANFVGARVPEEIIFTKGATESINRVAFNWAVHNLKKGDVILTTDIEHHSNLVPWQIVAQKTGAKLEFFDFNPNEPFPIAEAKKKIVEGVKLIAITHASNVLGTIFPIKEISKLAKQVGAYVSVDGAQAIPHLKVNVQSLGCDFYSFSGHKMLGPMGIGVLWAKREILEKMEPYEYGGGMISKVELLKSEWAEIPHRFEAGTPNVADAIGLGAAIDYLNGIGMDEVREHEVDLNKYALEKLSKVEGLEILGPKDADARSGTVSFNVKGIHNHDLASILNTRGIAVRAGQHCTMPLHVKLGIPSSTRASFYVYNTRDDIDALIDGISFAKQILL